MVPQCTSGGDTASALSGAEQGVPTRLRALPSALSSAQLGGEAVGTGPPSLRQRQVGPSDALTGTHLHREQVGLIWRFPTLMYIGTPASTPESLLSFIDVQARTTLTFKNVLLKSNTAPPTEKGPESKCTAPSSFPKFTYQHLNLGRTLPAPPSPPFAPAPVSTPRPTTLCQEGPLFPPLAAPTVPNLVRTGPYQRLPSLNGVP